MKLTGKKIIETVGNRQNIFVVTKHIGNALCVESKDYQPKIKCAIMVDAIGNGEADFFNWESKK